MPSPRTEHTLSATAHSRRQLRIFARAVLRWRSARGLSQSRLAAKIGCSNKMLSNIEANARDGRWNAAPSWALANTLARMMGKDLLRDFKLRKK